MWKPINTAPRDGSEILIYNKKWAIGAIRARWTVYTPDDDAEEDPAPFYCWKFENSVELELLGDSTGYGLLGFAEDIVNEVMPTHWTTLPGEDFAYSKHSEFLNYADYTNDFIVVNDWVAEQFVVSLTEGGLTEHEAKDEVSRVIKILADQIQNGALFYVHHLPLFYGTDGPDWVKPENYVELYNDRKAFFKEQGDDERILTLFAVIDEDPLRVNKSEL
jgi:hypothetical protein